MSIEYKTYPSTPGFNETPNGVLTTFTTSELFVVNTLTIMQGSLLWTDFAYTDPYTIEFGTAPLVPSEAGNLYILSGWFGAVVLPELDLDFWTAPDLQTAYGLSSLSTLILDACLLEAQTMMQGYVTTTAYATAKAGGTGYYRFKRVMAELALYYLDRRPLIAPQHVKASSKEYAGVKKYRQEYVQINGPEAWTEGWILGQLITYKATTTFEPCDEWGTGRFVSGSLTVEEEEES